MRHLYRTRLRAVRPATVSYSISIQPDSSLVFRFFGGIVTLDLTYAGQC